MIILNNDVLSKVASLSNQIIEWRRELHKHPELSFQEYNSARFIANQLSAIKNMKVDVGVGLPTAVIGTLSKGIGPTIAIRADIDALPIQEENTHSYTSQTAGVMHACGHDAHTAIAIGVATIMSELFEELDLNGTVKFIFQPAEETVDEFGKTGSPYLVESGILADVDCVLALHMNPEKEVGTVLVHDGYSMANVDVFEAMLSGTGGHGAYPHLTIDPISLLGQVIQSINQIVSRKVSPLDAAVISICEIKAGSASNIIPKEVYLSGTLRSYKPEVRKEIIEHLYNSFELTRLFGGDYELKIIEGEPALFNNAEVNEVIRESIKEALPTMVIENIPFGLGGEDFSHMVNKVPGAMIFLGCAINDDVKRELHTPIFDIDEKALSLGVTIFCHTLLKYFRSNALLPTKTALEKIEN